MAQRWYKKATVQSQLVAGTLLIVGILIGKYIDISNLFKQKSFYIKQHTTFILAYPGPIIHVYRSGLGLLIAPIGIATVIEFINNRPTLTKISSYTLDIKIGDSWKRIYNIAGFNAQDFFWVNNSNLNSCTRLDFRTNSFDLIAKDKSIAQGESIKGWMFFEWPPELRSNIPKISSYRISIENSQGETQTVEFGSKNVNTAGNSSLEGGEIHTYQPVEKIDLSGLRIMPFMDLLKGFQDNSLTGITKTP